MKHNFIKRMICTSLMTVSLLGFGSIGASAEWRQQDTHTLYYKDNNYLTGWQVIDGKKYYFNEQGYVAHGGWGNRDGKWYYYNLDGSALTNSWFYDKSNSKWYYFNVDGSMAINTTIDGYTLDSNGVYIQNNTVNNTSTTNTNINSGNTTTNNTVNNINNGIVNNYNNYGVINTNVDNSTNTTNIIIDSVNDDIKDTSRINQKIKDYNNAETEKKLSALKEERALWEKDNSTKSTSKIKELQDGIDQIENDKKYDKMSTSEQQSTLIAEQKQKIDSLNKESEQWKKDDSVESKKHQYDIQQKIKDAEHYIDIIS